MFDVHAQSRVDAPTPLEEGRVPARGNVIGERLLVGHAGQVVHVGPAHVLLLRVDPIQAQTQRLLGRQLPGQLAGVVLVGGLTRIAALVERNGHRGAVGIVGLGPVRLTRGIGVLDKLVRILNQVVADDLGRVAHPDKQLVLDDRAPHFDPDVGGVVGFGHAAQRGGAVDDALLTTRKRPRRQVRECAAVPLIAS